MSKLVIWDIDGTLLHCFGTGKEALEATYKEMYGIEGAMQRISLAGVVDSEVIKTINSSYGLSDFDSAAFYRMYAERLMKLLTTGQGIVVIDGIEPVLKNLQRPGLYHVIGTGNCKAGARVKLELSGLSDYFEHGAFGDEVGDRDALLALARTRAEDVFRTKFLDDEVMVIGDTPKDITSAKSNDFVAVATTTGYYDERELAVHTPDFIIDHFSELIGVIDNQWPKGY
ncbi:MULTISPECIES: HAD family hydrolase [unclassified Fusibacter]|uniref:HAD family hydrolase n=1 Tax=unclassified Fusibacter TaxID=2624464 RepID=UPI001013468D|nr:MULTISPECIES: HAD family hydrolase [unclassified Fusibacter]MCK8060706.1 HAD family hydrolase [Fusibacter sp. A2]NPE22840.1 HAD family hydrolase [Fusibacter sp. A1]RXV59909.1 HAD family hydrolase [Fusibacter sp. A1]